MLVFITSTSKDLYRRDMLNACCKLTDDLISFSYNKERISANIPDTTKGQTALIVFAEYKRTTPNFTFHPIRYCTITEAIDNTENASFTYHLKLGECIEYKYDVGNTSINNKLLTDFDAEVKKQLINPDESPDKLVYYFRILEIKTTLTSAPLEQLNTWPNLVKHLGNLDIFKESVFFRQRSIKGGIDLKEKDLVNAAPLQLLPGKTYDLCFLLIAGSAVKGSGVYPTIETSGNVNVQGPFINQESNAIALRYTLIVKGSAVTTYSSFLVRARAGKEDTTPISPEFNNYLVLKPRRIVNIMTFVFIVLGLIASNIADLIPTNKIFSILGIIQFESSTLINVIKIVASAVVAIGSYIVYSKIPKSD